MESQKEKVASLEKVLEEFGGVEDAWTMDPEIPEKNPASGPTNSPPEGSGGSDPEEGSAVHGEKTLENWFAGIGAGMKGVSQKLLGKIPPELREKIIEQVRTHGPGSAAVAVNAAALRTRSLKVKLALKSLEQLLKMLDSQAPKMSFDTAGGCRKPNGLNKRPRSGMPATEKFQNGTP